MNREDTAKALEKLRLEQEESGKRQAELVSEIDRLITGMKNEARRWMQEFLERIEEESEGLGQVPIDNLLKYYSFYCVDLLQEAMNTCIDYHKGQLFEYLEGISDELAKNLAVGFQNNKNYNFRMNLNNKIWTSGDTVGLTMSLLSQMGILGSITNVASLIIDGVSGTIRQREKGKRTGEIVEQISGKLTGLNLSVADT